MSERHRFYRALVHLYPRRFRSRFGEDLVQHFDDLVADRGARAAWTRTTLDLAITIPRYQLERVMTEQHSTATINIVIALLAASGFAGMILGTDGVGAWLGVIFVLAALGLVIARRSALARALQVPNSDRRRARLKVSAILGAIFAVSYGVYVLTVGDSWSLSDTFLTLIGTLAMFGAVGYLVVGLLTPRSPHHGQLAGHD